MITMKACADEEDFRLMQDLIRENYNHSDLQLYPGPSDLDYWRYVYDESPDGVRDARLWQDEKGRTLAFAWMNEDAVDFVCHYQHRELLSGILEWSEKERLKRDGEAAVNCLYIFDCDRVSELLAEERGYRRQGPFNYYGRRSLLEEIPRVQIPFGYTIKSIETPEEIRQRARLNGLAGNEISPDKYRYFMEHAATYRQDLDLIAVAPNGAVAGFCTVWHDGISNTGVFEPYAVDADHTGKGLGKCLLREGMDKLRSLGCAAVYVTHAGLESEERDAALALNEAVGFQRVGYNYLWVKQLGGTGES